MRVRVEFQGWVLTRGCEEWDIEMTYYGDIGGWHNGNGEFLVMMRSEWVCVIVKRSERFQWVTQGKILESERVRISLSERFSIVKSFMHEKEWEIKNLKDI